MSKTYDAAGGVSTPASPGAMTKKKTKKVMYCDDCRFHLLLAITKSNCSSCNKEMKEIGWIEYA
jgi:hypothetical protein